MKLAYLANLRFPSKRAHSLQIAHTCQAFSENGLQIDLFVNSRRICSKSEIDIFFGLDSKFSVIYVPFKLFFPTIKISFYIGELLFTTLFLLLADRKKYTFFYSRSEWVLYFLSFLIEHQKIVWESHEATYNFPARRLLKKGVKCVVISEGIEKFYLEKNTDISQLLVAHDAVDGSFFADLMPKEKAKEQLGLSGYEKVVMYIGGFDEWKGTDTFLQSSNHDNSFTYVAIGEYEEIMKTQYPNVLFLGSRPYTQLHQHQQAADILIIPNTAKNELSSKYTSPLKLFAHMTSGVPLLVSDVESLKAVLGTHGVMFEPDNPKSLSMAADGIFVDYKKHKENAKKLRDVSIKYTWENRTKKIIKFLS
jgi:glycosyltransferase involved in cell wall biosynthesis